MLGMRKTLEDILDYIKDFGEVKSFASDKLQIKHTCRYLIFWSFTVVIPKDNNNRLSISAKAKRIQTIDSKSISIVDLLSKLKENYAEELFENGDDEDFLLELQHNKWSRRYRRNPQNAAALQRPLRISVRQRENFIEFELLNNDAENEEWEWDTFVGFINHLRKEKE